MRITPARIAVSSTVLVLATAVSGWTADADYRVADAMKRQDASAVQMLVAAGADVNAPQRDGATALHWAAYWDDVPSASLLIRAGARVNALNENDVTPLTLGCTNASPQMVSTLLDAGGDANAAQTTGGTPLMTCSRTGSAAAVSFFNSPTVALSGSVVKLKHDFPCMRVLSAGETAFDSAAFM